MSTLAEESRFWFAYLGQGDFWLPRDRVPVRVADMDPGWCRNAMAWLRRRAGTVEIYYTHGELSVLAQPVPEVIGEIGGKPVERYVPGLNLLPTPGSMAADAFDSELDQRGQDPAEWLTTAPLWLALAARAEVSQA